MMAAMRDKGIIVIAGTEIGAVAALGVVRFVGGSPPARGIEGALAALALAAVLAAPGVLALLGRSGRPALLVVAGVALAPLSFLAFSGVTLPLLIPAMLLALAGARRLTADAPSCAPLWVTLWAVVAVLGAAVVALFAHHDPRSWATATSEGSTSDVITVAESLLSLWLVALALTLGWYLSTPLPSLRSLRGTGRYGDQFRVQNAGGDA
jgi:hypothetical protein